MEFKETQQERISGVSITNANEKIFHAIISINIHTEGKNVHREALSLIYSNMLLSGCNGYTRKDFLNAVNLLGASISVSIHNDVLTFTLQCLHMHKKKLLSLFSSMLKTPSFSASEIKRVALVLCNELEESKEDAKAESFRTFINTLYDASDKRYNSLDAKLFGEIRNIKKSDLTNFHDDVLGKKWLYTLIVDEKKRNETVKLLTDLRGFFEDTDKTVLNSKRKHLVKTQIVATPIPSKQNIELSIGASLPLSQDDPQYHAFVFGLNVLGKWGGFAGRLMSTVREKEGLTYGIYARTETATRLEGGHWRIMTFFAPDKLIQGVTSTLYQTRKIAAKGITEDEYKRFMDILETQETLLQDSLIKNASLIHSFLLRSYSYAEIKEYKNNRRNVTLEQVNKALKKYLDVTNIVISTAGPVASTEKELKRLISSKK